METLYGSQLAPGDLHDAIHVVTQRMEQLNLDQQGDLVGAYQAVLDDLIEIQPPVGDHEA